MGGKDLYEFEDMGFMYLCVFVDFDGYGFGFFWMDFVVVVNGLLEV